MHSKPATRPGRRQSRARNRLAALAALAVLSTAVCGPAGAGDAEPGSAADRSRSGADEHRLVRLLGAASIAQRDAAERVLVELGPAALPAVAAARRYAVGEAAFRLAGIQRVLERRAAEEAVEPAIVTFAADDRPVRDVLDGLFEKAGSRIDLAPEVRDGPAGDRRLSLRCDRVTFWDAVDEVLDRTGLAVEFRTVQDSAGGPRPAPAEQIVIADATRGATPAAAAGPLRVSVTAVERTGRATADATGSRASGVRTRLRVAWEPRLRPLFVRLPASSLVAEGLDGETLPVAQRAAMIEATIPPRRAWIDLPVLFAPPAVPLERLRSLRGTIVLWLTGMEHAFCFDGVRADRDQASSSIGKPVRVAQAEVCLLDARFEGDRLLVRVGVTYDAVSELLASHQPWLAERPVEAWLAGGRPLEGVDQRVIARTDRGITLTAAFALPAAGNEQADLRSQEVGIRWTLPIALHEVPVDFVLRDVTIPQGSAP